MAHRQPADILRDLEAAARITDAAERFPTLNVLQHEAIAAAWTDEALYAQVNARAEALAQQAIDQITGCDETKRVGACAHCSGVRTAPRWVGSDPLAAPRFLNVGSEMLNDIRAGGAERAAKHGTLTGPTPRSSERSATAGL